MSSSTASSTKLDPAVVRVAVALLVGGIAVIFDTTIVAVALHELAADLNTDVATIQWVSTGYLLALGVTLPLVGWLQSRLGGKRLWIGSPGAICTRAKQMMVTPRRIGTVITRRRKA